MLDRKALLLWACATLVASCGGGQPEPSTVVLPRAAPTPDPPEGATGATTTPRRPPRSADTDVGPAPSSAEAARAQELFSEGKALMAAGAIPQACAKFEASHRIDPAMGTLLNLAACEELAGHVPRACRLFREVAQLAQARAQMERAQYATDRAVKLGCSP